MTRNLKLYAIFSILWSVAFFACLQVLLADPQKYSLLLTVTAFTYALGFALVGWLLSKTDDQSRVRYSLSWRYSLISTIASFVIGAGWVVLFRPSAWPSLVIYLLIASLFLMPEHLSERRSIKGVTKRELFK